MDESERRPVWLAVLSGVGRYLGEALYHLGGSMTALHWPSHWHATTHRRPTGKEHNRA
jgi:hypothetical protein